MEKKQTDLPYAKSLIINDWSIKELVEKVNNNEIDLEAEYQRENVWNITQRKKLIDSILKKIDIPKIYLALIVSEDEKEKRYECIDGKQRLNAINDFYREKNSTEKNSTSALTDLENQTYSQLTIPQKKIFDERKLTIAIIEDPNERYIAQLFERLNLGTPLNGAEKLNGMTFSPMRNALFLKNFDEQVTFFTKVKFRNRRFSGQLMLSQMVYNSREFRDSEEIAKDKFRRSRWEELANFFGKFESQLLDVDRLKIEKILANLVKIEKNFPSEIPKIGKAAIVSLYLFAEELMETGNEKDLGLFIEFYIKLTEKLQYQSKLIKDHKAPDNKVILDKFQKYIQQASAEDNSIRIRHIFLRAAFSEYRLNHRIISQIDEKIFEKK